MEKKKKSQVEPKLEKLKQEIRILSSQLKKLGEEKEIKYKEKEKVEKELNQFIKSAKSLRDKKKNIDEEVKTLKIERDKFNKELKLMFSRLAEIKSRLGLQPKGKKKGRTESPLNLLKQIESMQFAIETEVLSFEREKMYMERIKKLKTRLEELNAEESKFKEVKDFKKKIKAKKDEADALHAKIQKLAKESSQLFKDLTAISNGIAQSKKAKSKLQGTLKELKIKIDNLNQKLGSLLKEWSEETAGREGEIALEVMDKFKKKKKLTKEDILLIQRQALKGKS